MVCAAAVASGIAQAQANSLWVKAGNSEQSMFADKVARNIGDILTVAVEESYSTVATSELKTANSYQAGDGIGIALNSFLNQFLAATPRLLGLATGPSTVNDDQSTTIPVGGGNTLNIPTINFETFSKWDSSGNIADNRLTANSLTSVTVVDVLPNGNLVVEGAKIIRSSHEDVYAYMRGIVRPIDIDDKNIVSSTKIADAQVEFKPAGELTEAEKKGWLLRGLEKIAPF